MIRKRPSRASTSAGRYLNYLHIYVYSLLLGQLVVKEGYFKTWYSLVPPPGSGEVSQSGKDVAICRFEVKDFLHTQPRCLLTETAVQDCTGGLFFNRKNNCRDV